jgi:hypothetical protein
MTVDEAWTLDTARIGIIRRAKNPQTPPIIRYRDTRTPICAYLSDGSRRVNPLVAAEEMLKQRAEDASESALRHDDAKQSIEVLHAIQRMQNQLRPFILRSGASSPSDNRDAF